MIENTTTTATAAVPAVMADILDLSDPQALVDAHAAAVNAGQVSLAEEIARFVAHVGHELRATASRVDHDLSRCHENRYDELHAEDDEVSARLRILEAVPALKAAIDALAQDDVAAIWAQYGPYDVEDDE
ncbi:hypothetical protein FV242_31370 [Methylobacterium sp. WL64]|uniref:hypothetical protein n=1 Tax=Methylobacterium sp. WL64 TaxID=2603894 RepID=UPI0011C82A70|nr:hypothetical protein [Methylobacterium sp. WL64]TXM97503.1 hypothetical protein FV242_31370 [Methylobacterium sp. WL64]